MPHAPILVALVIRAVGRWRERRERIRTRRIVSRLSPQMQKDIGWCEPEPPRTRRGLTDPWMS